MSNRVYGRRKLVVRADKGATNLIDMMRYCRCVPAAEEDANRVDRFVNRYDPHAAVQSAMTDNRDITFYRYFAVDRGGRVGASTGQLADHEVRRWHAYHWLIISDKFEE